MIEQISVTNLCIERKTALSELNKHQSVGTLSRLEKFGKHKKKIVNPFWRRLRWSTLVAVLGWFTWFYFTDTGSQVRLVIADSVIITQHREWAKYLIGTEALANRVKFWVDRADEYAVIPDLHHVHIVEEQKPSVTYEVISGSGWSGYLLTISDPKKIRVIVTSTDGTGEQVSHMVSRTGAIAGVNAGGFVDTNWRGNGFKPIGLVMSGGRLYYNSTSRTVPQHIVGIDRDGKMVAGKYTANELDQLGVQEAVTFAPRFIVNGVGQIPDAASGWGIAPRTAMAQREDGSILFAIIDGRQQRSIGATLYDVQELFLKHGAVIAANLDGGASTVLVYKNQIINNPCSKYGERYVPTAFLVYDNPAKVLNPNIWEGKNPKSINAVSKKNRKNYNLTNQ